MKKKILFVTNVNPFTASFGAEQRSYVFLQAFLQNGFLVDVVYTGTTIEDKSKCPSGCRVVFWNEGYQWRFSRKANFLRIATICMYPVCREQELIIDQLVVKNNYDYIACRYIPTASTAGLFKYAERLLLDIDDLPASAMEAQMGPDRWYKELYHKQMVQSVKNETKRWLCKSKVCFLPNKLQSDKYKCVFLPNIPVFHVDEVIHSPGNKNILFIGLMSYRPNWEGVDTFINKCWDKIIKCVPEAHFLIAGKGLTSELKKSWESKKNIKVLGFVDSVADFYSKGNIVIVPVYTGAGTNIKVIEALSFGKATVLSPFSTKGYEDVVVDNENTIIADNFDRYVTCLVNLLGDEKKCFEIAYNGYQKVSKFYSQHSINKIISNIIK